MEVASNSGDKRGACLRCRKSKIKCIRSSNERVCQRCNESNAECVIPTVRTGRQKGAKNKHHGLAKAYHQIRAAVSNYHNGTLDDESRQLVLELRALLENIDSPVSSSPSQMAVEPDLPDSGLPTLEDAENPLKLLARASELRPPKPVHLGSYPNQNHVEHSQITANRSWAFLSQRASLDVGPDLDPIDLGLASESEAQRLLDFFHRNLSHTRWGVDAQIYTLAFLRRRSAFLTTSILSASAKFISGDAALSTRLSSHSKRLAQEVIKSRYRSVEIVLAFMINVPWISPGKHSADDEACHYIAMALSIALDLCLNKIVVPSQLLDPESFAKMPRSCCIEANAALQLDGYEVHASSEVGQKLLRQRERAWIALFVLERGSCLARGRDFTVPTFPLIENCDSWHELDYASTWDGSMNSLAILRRDLEQLLNGIKLKCDNRRNGPETAREISIMIESFFEKWTRTWMPLLTGQAQVKMPAYVDILVTHTRLSTYGSVINHPTAPMEAKALFRKAGITSAIDVMRTAIQEERNLSSMPNNTVIMVSYAACFALGLSRTLTDNEAKITSSIYGVIEDTANVLERIGTVTSHRNGASYLYGRYLREMLRKTAKPGSVSAPEVPLNGHSANTFAMPMHTEVLNQLPLDLFTTPHRDIDQFIGNFDNTTAIAAAPFDNMVGLDWVNWNFEDARGELQG